MKSKRVVLFALAAMVLTISVEAEGEGWNAKPVSPASAETQKSPADRVPFTLSDVYMAVETYPEDTFNRFALLLVFDRAQTKIGNEWFIDGDGINIVINNTLAAKWADYCTQNSLSRTSAARVSLSGERYTDGAFIIWEVRRIVRIIDNEGIMTVIQ
jgi:hypothetical protein